MRALTIALCLLATPALADVAGPACLLAKCRVAAYAIRAAGESKLCDQTAAGFDALTPVHRTDGHVSPCHGFRNNEVRLRLHALAYTLGNFLRTLALPEAVEHWSLTTLREKLIKIRAKIVRHGRYITFQLAEVAIPRSLFAKVLRLIGGLRLAPLPP